MKKVFLLVALMATAMFTSCEPEKDEFTNNNGGSGNYDSGSETPAPQADFSFSGTNNYPPCTITFTNKSKNANYYSWDFGDGKTSSLIHQVINTPMEVFIQ